MKKLFYSSEICTPGGVLLYSPFFEQTHWRSFSLNHRYKILQTTTGGVFFNHRADTLEVFSEKNYVMRAEFAHLEICA